MERSEVRCSYTRSRRPKQALKEALTRVPADLRDTINQTQFAPDQIFGFQDHHSTTQAQTLAQQQLAFFAEAYPDLVRERYGKPQGSNK